MNPPSYACGRADVPLLGETIGENLRRVAEGSGEWERTGRVAGELLARGVVRGDRVGVWATNRYEWIVLQFATARIGAVLVALNPTYEATEHAYALQHSGTSVLFHSARYRESDCAAVVAEIAGECPQLRESVVFEAEWAQFESGDPDPVTEAECQVDFDQGAQAEAVGRRGLRRGNVSVRRPLCACPPS